MKRYKKNPGRVMEGKKLRERIKRVNYVDYAKVRGISKSGALQMFDSIARGYNPTLKTIEKINEAIDKLEEKEDD